MLAAEPQGIIATIESGLRLFRATLAGVLPAAVLTGSLNAAVMTGFTAAAQGLEGLEQGPELTAATQDLLIWLPLIYGAGLFAVATVAYAVTMRARGIEVGTQAALSRGLTLTLPLTIVAIGYLSLLTVGLFALVVPGVLIAVSAILFPYVPVFEDRSPWGALYRSHELIWPRQWLRTAAVVVVIGVITLAASSLLSLLLLPVLMLADPQAPWAALSLAANFLANWVALALLLPLSSALFITLYQDLKLRQEAAAREDRAASNQASDSFDA
ncbi:MAG: hypothetical protein AAGG11_19855 [Pseudomonadota bacterium]